MKQLHRLIIFGLLLAGVIFAIGLPINSTYIILPFVILSFIVLLPRDMLKNFRIMIWIFFIVVSIILLGLNLNPSGYSVISVSKNSTLSNIAVGEVIYKINELPATDDSFQQQYYGTIKFETNRGSKFDNANGTLGIEVNQVSASNLKFGLDLNGGVRAVIDANTTDKNILDQTITTLQTRINVYGLRETAFRPIYYEGRGYVEISMAGGSKEELRNLLGNQGRFDAKINFLSRTIGGAGTLRFDKTYTFTVSNGTMLIDNRQIKTSDIFEISGVNLTLNSIQSDSVNVTANVFNGNDIRIVYFDPQRSRIEAKQNGYQWSFVIQISQEGAKRFAIVTSNMDVIPGSGSLNGPIVFYLDDRLVDALSISSSLKGKVETEISITGGGGSRDIAIKERARLQSILKSGALPTAVSIVQLESISPTLGLGFLKNALLAGAAALIGVVIVVGLRYRRAKVVVPMIIISASEVLIILGIAAIINWTIDLPAIAGIIATIGTGIDSQIIIIDQALRGEDKTMTMKEKLSHAFFVVFGGGGTVIAAMIPIALIVYAFRGFAITTIIGVLVGILVVRPAFGVIVQKIVKE